MAADSKVIALVSACLSLGTSGAVAALAIERDRNAVQFLDAALVCPPGACSIVVKTAEGGGPSVIHTVPAPVATPASTVRPAAPSTPVLVAAAEAAR